MEFRLDTTQNLCKILSEIKSIVTPRDHNIINLNFKKFLDEGLKEKGIDLEDVLNIKSMKTIEREFLEQI